MTLAFGEIVGRFLQNGDEITIFGDYALSNGRESISPLDQINLPFLASSTPRPTCGPFYWTMLAIVLVVLFVNFRLRDSRLGRAWIALREDEVAAASMGVPLVKTKLPAYAAGGAFGGISGCFYGAYLNSVNANQFQFGFSIFILAMVILGGLGSIWGVVLGAVALSFVNYRLIPDVLDGECVRRRSTTARARLHVQRGHLRGLRLHPRPDDGAATGGPAARAPPPDRAHRRRRGRARGAG